MKYQRRGAMYALAPAALKHVHVHVRPQGCCPVYPSHALCLRSCCSAVVVQGAAAPCAGKVYFIANGESTQCTLELQCMLHSCDCMLARGHTRCGMSDLQSPYCRQPARMGCCCSTTIPMTIELQHACIHACAYMEGWPKGCTSLSSDALTATGRMCP